MTRVEQYIRDYTRSCSNKLSDIIYSETGNKYYPWLTPDHARRVAEIAREETIKKACEWLTNNFDIKDYTSSIISGVCHIRFDMEKLCDDLKKAIEGGEP